MGVVPPAARRILADEIVEAIRDAIVSGQLKFGERLPESALANNLHVSRGPVREALARLSQEGIVQIERHRGASVARLGVDEVDEIYSLRQALECLATEWLCRNATAEDFERISLVLRQCDQLPDPLSFTDIAHLDVAFHDCVFEAAHHERLYEAWLSLRSQILLLLARSGELRKHPAQSWRKDHEDLLEVLVRAEPAEAVRVVRDHIDGTYTQVRELSHEAAGNPVPTSTRPRLLALETAIVPEQTPATPYRTRSAPLRRTVDRVDVRTRTGPSPSPDRPSSWAGGAIPK